MRIFPINKPCVIGTMGDPAGIGPEVIGSSLEDVQIPGEAALVLVGDTELIERYLPGRYSKKDLNVISLKEEISLDPSRVNIIDPGPDLRDRSPGLPTSEGARKALNCLFTSVAIVKALPDASRAGIVTGPVNKSAIASISPGFIGHTEYFRDSFPVEHTTMVLAGDRLCVSPVTRHIPVADVPTKLTPALLAVTIRDIVANRKFLTGKDDPVIGVSALNPHCGEDGTIGREEIDMIAPVVNAEREQYKNIIGPVSADTIFYKALKGDIDIVIAMYHDQGLAPFKMIDFDSGVNVTLGLPCVRTSPDHGTAYDIAGRGVASSVSMRNAFKLALRALCI
ncbi:MAG: 4-hydroxythreonine-4-phosphate dehydrogenase PdxA [Candidatus Omnitrophica bacterium]|nr:4-hydroxythreonine-4-phosphate dehydrogenase PdxA [Candidatus Omnitrophota bacterium]